MVSSMGIELSDILKGSKQASATSSGCVSSSVMGSMSAHTKIHLTNILKAIITCCGQAKTVAAQHQSPDAGLCHAAYAAPACNTIACHLHVMHDISSVLMCTANNAEKQQTCTGESKTSLWHQEYEANEESSGVHGSLKCRSWRKVYEPEGDAGEPP